MKFRNPFAKKPAEALPTVPSGGDALDLTNRGGQSDNGGGFNTTVEKSIQRNIDNFVVVPTNMIGMDSAVAVQKVGDAAAASGGFSGFNNNTLSPLLADWYASQGFIGHQMCAIIAQHWLVGKACATPAEDALRNGWSVDVQDADDTTNDAEEIIKRIHELDKRMKVDNVMFEAAKFANVFGIRILIPIIESNDKDYYTKPFNLDGVTAESFRGWTQIDPQWIYPLLDSVGAGDPNSPTFYEPEYWVAGQIQYHRSHLVILKTEEPADILKPTYLFSGIPLPQRIAERVYGAERTANEAPLLAMSKRTTTLKVDLAKAGMKKQSFVQRLLEWIDYRDNFNVRVIGKDEELNESDTSLADLDDVIMTQYQIVAGIAKVPSTKLLGTSPKGFGGNGDYELKSYHEHLETIQSTWYDRFLERHYLLMSKAYLNGVVIEHTWEPVDSIGAEAEATLQKTKAETAAIYIDKGVISPDEDRSRLRLDKDSGYSLPEDVDAPGIPAEPTTPGAGGFGQDGEEDNSKDGSMEVVMLAASVLVALPSINKPSAQLRDLVNQLVCVLNCAEPEPKSVVASVVGVKGLEASVVSSVGEAPQPPEHLKK